MKCCSISTDGAASSYYLTIKNKIQLYYLKAISLQLIKINVKKNNNLTKNLLLCLRMID